MSKTKTIYRDKLSNRLITPHQAKSRDPATYTIEEFERPNPGQEHGIARELEADGEEQLITAA